MHSVLLDCAEVFWRNSLQKILPQELDDFQMKITATGKR